MHGLRPSEAARRTEKAIAEGYERGDMELSVIVGPIERGQASIKSTIQKTLRECVSSGFCVNAKADARFASHKITFRDDPSSADRILVSLPYPSIM